MKNTSKPKVVRTASTPEKAKVIVKRGVALLDKAKPGWFQKVNLEKFDLGNERTCVLGYVYRNFFDGLYTLAADAAEAKVPNLRAARPAWSGRKRLSEYYYGFNFRTSKSGEYLSQEWKRVISRRQRRAV